MTGFGRGIAEQGGVRATVDVRSVNHRYLDLKLRGTAVAPATEDAVATRIRRALERGSVTASIHVARAAAPGGVRVDLTAARAAHGALAELARALGLPGPDLALVVAQPGVLVAAGEPDEGAEAAVLAAADAALAQLVAMREAEGGALAHELAARLDELGRIQAHLAERAAALPELLHHRLRDRLSRLLQGGLDPASPDAAGRLDPGRLAQEVALLAERADVTEELVRLASHLEQARALVAGPGAAGRRLEFLVQELGRELNTIGSKSAAADLTAAVVEGKAVLEKVREQIQNVE